MTTTTTTTTDLDAAVLAVLTAAASELTPSAIARKLRTPFRGVGAGATYAAAARLVKAGRAADRWRGTSLVYFRATTTTTTTIDETAALSAAVLAVLATADARGLSCSAIARKLRAPFRGLRADDVRAVILLLITAGSVRVSGSKRAPAYATTTTTTTTTTTEGATTMADETERTDETERASVARIMADAGLTPYVWEGQYYRGAHPTADDVPRGGETAYLSNYRAVRGDEAPDAWEVPVTLWGDYCGDDCGRSNHGALLADYGHALVSVTGDYWSRCLLIPATIDAEDAEALAEIGVKLRDDYPLYDEGHHSMMEMEAATDAWDEYLGSDIRWSLTRDHGLDSEDVDAHADLIRELFYAAVRDADQWPYFESATSIVFPGADDHTAAIAAELVKRGARRETA